MEREDPAWEERSILIFEKMKGNRRKESGLFWADWVWEVDTNIRRKGKEQGGAREDRLKWGIEEKDLGYV